MDDYLIIVEFQRYNHYLSLITYVQYILT